MRSWIEPEWINGGELDRRDCRDVFDEMHPPGREHLWPVDATHRHHSPGPGHDAQGMHSLSHPG